MNAAEHWIFCWILIFLQISEFLPQPSKNCSGNWPVCCKTSLLKGHTADSCSTCYSVGPSRSFPAGLLHAQPTYSLYWGTGLFQPRCRTRHLSVNLTSFPTANSSSPLRSLWMAALPFSYQCLHPQLGVILNLGNHSFPSFRLLMKTLNSGGTSLITGCQVDVDLLAATFWAQWPVLFFMHSVAYMSQVQI